MAENLAGIGVGAGGAQGAVVPTCRQGGQTVSNAPHFADLWNDACKHGKKNIGIYRWKCVKYYQKCVKFACNYFKNSSASGDFVPWTPLGDSRPPDPLVLPHLKPPSAAYPHAHMLLFSRQRGKIWISSSGSHGLTEHKFLEEPNTAVVSRLRINPNSLM